MAHVRLPTIPQLAEAPWIRVAPKTYRILRLYCGFFRTGVLSSAQSVTRSGNNNYKRASLSGPGVEGAAKLSTLHKSLVLFRVKQSKRTEVDIKNRFTCFFSMGTKSISLVPREKYRFKVFKKWTVRKILFEKL